MNKLKGAAKKVQVGVQLGGPAEKKKQEVSRPALVGTCRPRRAIIALWWSPQRD